MICDVLIIKDSLPLLSKSLSNSSNVKNMFSEIDNLIMVSGFFSALNSFSNSFDSLGCISELKMDNSNLKLSFLKDTNLPELIFLATFDSGSELKSVQRFLEKILDLFLKEYDYDQIRNWNGKLDHFKAFETVIEQEINEEEIVEQKKHDIQAFNWLTSFEIDDDDGLQIKEEIEHIEELPEFYKYIPTSMTNITIGVMRNYLTGDTSVKIYDVIDGKKTINIIAKELSMEQFKVYNICKNLVKFGFISFN